MRFAGPTLGPTFARRLRRTSTDKAGRFGALSPNPGNDVDDHRAVMPIAVDRLRGPAISPV
jgi:hypothetical protein